ncbi:site-specific DNA-methyltransferase [Roseomonas xinghualingensis]|uniref:site-specific DNA-methyltransferase n=1 Tax=Roseomonas xinghualingensis TaxID=2986475 RepID=UPI0021F1C780|nr:site-specific DNA-methyltransferase [Roseomonas sp. SXEYE001]MCV4209754.1 site-specific DNA-methyltransferase [Roseomonas sp. SXEYE001]
MDRVWPADHVERWPLSRLTPYARNARTHSEAQVAQIAASIREWGWTVPVLVGEDGTIIAGHGRVLAAQRLALAEVPVMVARGWSEAKRRAYVLADNKLTLNGGWDEALLRAELADLAGLGADLSLTGFSAEEVQALIAEASAGLTDPDAVPPAPEVPVSRLGDIWILGRHRLVCGDCTDQAVASAVLAGVRPHLMVTDPPYGVDYDPAWRNETLEGSRTARTGKVLNDDRADWTEAWALFPGDVAYVWHGALHAATVAESLTDCGFGIRAQVIWAKERLVLGRGHYHWQHEPCWYAVRNGARGHWAGDRKQTTLWSIPSRDQDADTVHGTQKPVECMRRPIENNSSPGQAVYEPFSGSGTTLIAAEMTGRACHAIELSPAYVDVAVLRWQAFTGQEAVREGSGQRFAHLAQERCSEGVVAA